jgi:hypothetical protein
LTLTLCLVWNYNSKVILGVFGFLVIIGRIENDLLNW